jgi:hypothetical protein
MPNPISEFMRLSAPDPQALERGIVEMPIKLAATIQASEPIAIVDVAAPKVLPQFSQPLHPTGPRRCR